MGNKMYKKNKLVCGVGINDVDYTVQPTVNGKRITCPYYRKWRNMLRRCYSDKYHETHPTYIGVTVCNEWKYFSNFKRWVDEQGVENWEKLNLDKDFLVKDNKVYSSDTCVFIPQGVNNFITDRERARGSLPLGVCMSKGRYVAQISNPFIHKLKNLGYYSTSEEAHLVWKTKKHEYACKLAETVSDKRIADRLRTMYAI